MEEYENKYKILESEIERLNTLLDAAKTCIDECEYAMSKVTVDRVDAAIRTWREAVETYTEREMN